MLRTIGQKGVQVTPSDTNYITDGTNKVIGTLYIGVSGDVNVLLAEHADTNNAYTTGTPGGALLFKNFPVGPFPYGVRKVFSTGTTATDINCIYD